MKRLVYMAICVAFIMSILPKTARAEEESACAVFGADVSCTEIDRVFMDDISAAEYNVQIDEDRVWKILAGGTAEPLLYFDIADSFGSSDEDGSAFDIEVTYYDIGSGYFAIWYDALNYGSQLAKIVYLTGTGEKKTEVVSVDDAAFNKGIMSKADVMLSLAETGSYYFSRSPSDLYIKELRVKKHKEKNPVLCESYINESGNTFSYFEENKNVINTFTNTTAETKNVTARYTLTDNAGTVHFETTESFSVNGRESVIRNINIKSDRCGLYKWNVRLTDNKSGAVSDFDEDTVCIVKTDPDGIRSSFGYSNIHAERYPEESSKQCIDLMKKANIAGTRLEVLWKQVEKSPGVYSFESSTCYNAMRYLDDLDMPYWILLNGGNDIYDCAGIPKTEEQYEAFRNYCAYIVNRLNGKTDLFEIWNEPDIKSFNPDDATPENLAMITKIFREEAIKVNPELKVSGMSITGLNDRKNRFEYWLKGALDSGICDNGMNVLALHTYAPDVEPEKAKIYDIVKEYKSEVAKYGIENIPILISEYGNSTVDPNTTEENKANWIARAAILYLANGVGDYISQYNFEKKGVIAIDREDNFGMVSNPKQKYNIEGKVGIPTETYLIYAAMNYILGGEVEANGIFDPCENIKINRFRSKKFNKDIFALWSVGGEKNICINLGAKTAECFDKYGNSTEIYSENGEFNFRLSESPLYIMGDFSEAKILGISDDFDGLTDIGTGDELKGWDKKYYIGDSGGSVTIVNMDETHKNSVKINTSEITLSDGRNMLSLIGYGNGAGISMAADKKYIYSAEVFVPKWQSDGQSECLFYLSREKDSYKPGAGFRITDGQVFAFEPISGNDWNVKEIVCADSTPLELQTEKWYRLDIVVDAATKNVYYYIDGISVYSSSVDSLETLSPNICFSGRASSDGGIIFDNISSSEYKGEFYIYDVEVFGQDGRVTDMPDAGAEIYASISAANHFEYNKSAIAILCAYKNNMLKKAAYKKLDIQPGYTTAFGDGFTLDEDYDSLKIFVFNDWADMTPLSKSKKLDKQ